MPARTARHYRQVIAEILKVVWPSRDQLVAYTCVVIVFVTAVIALVSGLDLAFSRLSLLIFG